MSISYKPLWHQLIERDMRKIEFRDKVGISNTTLAKLGKNEPVSLEIIDKICTKLECAVGKIPTAHFLRVPEYLGCAYFVSVKSSGDLQRARCCETILPWISG